MTRTPLRTNSFFVTSFAEVLFAGFDADRYVRVNAVEGSDRPAPPPSMSESLDAPMIMSLNVQKTSACHPSRPSVMTAWRTEAAIRQAIAATLSDFNLLRQFQGVVHLDAEIADRALQLAMAEQQRAGA